MLELVLYLSLMELILDLSLMKLIPARLCWNLFSMG